VGRVDGRDEGFTVLDGAALVVAAAVASVHMRGPVRFATGAAWVLVWIAFAGVALTSAGPLVFLVRRYWRRPEGYPRIGDQLWAVLGIPWVACSPLGAATTASNPLGVYATALSVTLAVACLLVLASLWKVWVLTAPDARTSRSGPVPWTERLGMALAVAWPLQCGFLLVVLDSESMPAR